MTSEAMAKSGIGEVLCQMGPKGWMDTPLTVTCTTLPPAVLPAPVTGVRLVGV